MLLNPSLVCNLTAFGFCWMLQETERAAVAEQTALLAFDRQNHMGASDSLAQTIRAAIQASASGLVVLAGLASNIARSNISGAEVPSAFQAARA